MKRPILLACLLAGLALAGEEPKPAAPKEPVALSVRIKDVAEILGVRENQLSGVGLVAGLDRAGDLTGKLTPQALANFVKHYGITIDPSTLLPRDVALVAVTAQLPAFAKKGARLDVQVSALGDASSLQGGVLIQTPLMGGDGKVYATAQGAISIGGFNVTGGGGGLGAATVQKNHTLAGRIPNGALVEKEVPTAFERDGTVRIVLRKPDITTAQRMAEAIEKRWPGLAKAVDPFTVEFMIPVTQRLNGDRMAVLAELETLRFLPDVVARVVINERTGTIVAGSHVQLLPAIISHGNLIVTIKETPVISQPGPFSQGTTVATSTTTVTATEEGGRALVVEQKGPTLGDLAAALNALKVKPRDIISIFQNLKEAGALNADLVIL
ncbi:MAG: flagellar basal body P-ring protein FlgI [Planctomycetota bacterium]